MDWNNLLEWFTLILRWFHVMAAISWIGSSMYVLWLGRMFAGAGQGDPQQRGEPWMIHSTGVALAARFNSGSDQTLKLLHWFQRESALLWVSGFMMLYFIYYSAGGALLTVTSVSLPQLLAFALLSALLLGAGWVIYDALWTSPLGRRPAWAAGVSLALLALLAWGLQQVFSGRAVFIHVSSILGTLMFANVWLRLAPALKDRAGAAASGRTPDASLWARAQVRSQHNDYLMFPVVATMLAGHIAAVHGGPLAWLLLSLMLVAFAAGRHVVVTNLKSRGALLVLLLALAVMIALTARTAVEIAPKSETLVPFAAAQQIVTARCLACHSATPADRRFGPAPGGLSLDAPEDLRRHAGRIKSRIIDQQMVPIADHPQLTAQERSVLSAWIAQGASLQ